MQSKFLSGFILPLFAALSFSLSAAPASSTVSGELSASQSQPPSSAYRPPSINLNTADASTLQRELNGIGQAKAQAIVAYREANGPFQSVDELLEIKGIGNALMERNRDKLSLE